MSRKIRNIFYTLFFVIFGIAWAIYSFNENKALNSYQEDSSGQAETSNVPDSNNNDVWYEGGSLHQATALEWQQASYENKLATCADFIMALWNKNMLKPAIQSKIQSVEDVKPLAQELVVQMDEAMKENSNSQENREIYTNQKVGDIATMLLILMGWA